MKEPAVEPARLAAGDAGRLPDQARVAVLVNPAARSAGDRALVSHAARVLSGRYRVDVTAPESPAALSGVARDLAATRDAIVVAGGDGTVHHVINALAGLRVPMGLLPLGTGNDLARSLGVPAGPDAAARVLLAGRLRAIDLVEVNGRLFCTVGVIGLAAEATMAYNRLLAPGSWTRPLMKRTGGFAYRLAGLLAVLRAGAAGDMTVVVDEARPSGPQPPALAVFITNGTMLGGGMTLPVDSRLDDAALEIVWVNAMPRLRLVWAFACLANGWRIPDGAISVVRGAHASIATARPSPFAADGEVMPAGTRFDVLVKPAALQVFAPPA